MKVIVFLGPPGSGKGTQAKLLSKSLNVALLGMGDLLRKEIQNQTSVGRQIQTFVDAGDIPHWDMVSEVFKSALSQWQESSIVIFDGVPRNKIQVQSIEHMLNSHNSSVFQAIFLDVPSDVLIKRIMSRYQCFDCGMSYADNEISPKKSGICDFCGSDQFTRRDDDQEEVIKRRLAVYNETVAPLLAHYKSKKSLSLMDGTLSVEALQKSIIKNLYNLCNADENDSHLLLNIFKAAF